MSWFCKYKLSFRDDIMKREKERERERERERAHQLKAWGVAGIQVKTKESEEFADSSPILRIFAPRAVTSLSLTCDCRARESQMRHLQHLVVFGYIPSRKKTRITVGTRAGRTREVEIGVLSDREKERERLRVSAWLGSVEPHRTCERFIPSSSSSSSSYVPSCFSPLSEINAGHLDVLGAAGVIESSTTALINQLAVIITRYNIESLFNFNRESPKIFDLICLVSILNHFYIFISNLVKNLVIFNFRNINFFCSKIKKFAFLLFGFFLFSKFRIQFFQVSTILNEIFCFNYQNFELNFSRMLNWLFWVFQNFEYFLKFSTILNWFFTNLSKFSIVFFFNFSKF